MKKAYVPHPVPEDEDYCNHVDNSSLMRSENFNVIKRMEEIRVKFLAGDGLQLLACLYLCARYQAVIPEWAADALISLEVDIESGRFAHLNEALGTPSETKRSRAARARKKAARKDVLEELWRQRMSGSSLNAEEIFTPALENLQARGIDVNFRDIQEIYREDGGWLRDVPRNTPLGHGRIFAFLELQRPRRRRRSVFDD